LSTSPMHISLAQRLECSASARYDELLTRSSVDMNKKLTIPVIDLFAGPGGLAEGFSTAGDRDLEFEVLLSVEKDPAAHRTLTLRSFYRELARTGVPPEYYGYLRGEISWRELFTRFPVACQKATSACLCKELGSDDDSEIHAAIEARLRGRRDNWVLIGGPPCQAYSIVGRSRMSRRPREKFEADARHYLYRQYLTILAKFGPPAFVMENVKGLLSSRINGDSMFRRILKDLSAPGEALPGVVSAVGHRGPRHYRVVPIDFSGGSPDEFDARDFVMRAEDHGVPQKRHRVILLGVRRDLEVDGLFELESEQDAPAVLEMIDDLPRLRSQLSREPDSPESWHAALQQAWQVDFAKLPDHRVRSLVRDAIAVARGITDVGGRYTKGSGRVRMRQELRDWFLDENLKGACNHESRPHRRDDLSRYLFVSAFGLAHGRTPKLADFPEHLLPDHRNARKARESHELFDDRFRVQVGHEPATTVTSHVAKDGHYYIHHDPSQCRSWTVREAARIQTFPDNYFFEGTRTQQYVQVGNAVPPLLARAIARKVARLVRKWVTDR